MRAITIFVLVSPLRGEWIEIDLRVPSVLLPTSRLSEASGLKFHHHLHGLVREWVSPLRGEWIEIAM